MIKPLLRSISVAAFALVLSPLHAESFDVEENFDEPSHFENEGDYLPKGWSQPETANRWDPHFYVTDGWDFGYAAESGSKILGGTGLGNGVTHLFTPAFECGKGTKFTMEFSYMYNCSDAIRRVGYKVYCGREADISKMTLVGTQAAENVTVWSSRSYSYDIPEDGEYFFAIELFRNPDMSGTYGSPLFDTFFFTGETPKVITPSDVVPNPDNASACEELPWIENFSDATHYDGEGYLPKGWLTVGTSIWRTANITDIPAVSGEYYMISPESDKVRDERAYTPFFNLTAGVTYTISFHTHFDGYLIGDTPHTCTLNFTLGTEQDADFQPLTLLSLSRTLDTDPQWVKEEITFTPVNSGPYCFAFQLAGPEKSGFICIDDFRITSPVDTPRPQPKASPKGFFNFIDSNLFAFKGNAVRILNRSEYAETTSWDVDGAEVTVLENGDADVVFPASGEYSVRLTATNERGSRTSNLALNVTLLDELTENLPLLNFNPGEVKYYDRGAVPCFDTDPDGLDFVSGFNHYYRRYAERYDLPSDWHFTPRVLSLWMTNFRLRPVEAISPVDQASEPFYLTVYGADEDGNLDEDKVIYRHESTVAEFFGTTGIGGIAGEGITHKFDKTVSLDGTVYIAFEFSDGMIVDVTDPNIGRSFFSLGMLRHGNGVPTFYVQPFDKPEESPVATDGSWCSIYDFEPKAGALGLNCQLWVDMAPETIQGGIGSVDDDSISLRYFNNSLIVSGVTPGTEIRVCDAMGRLRMHTAVTSANAVVDCSALGNGVFVVSVGSKSVKFVK